MSVTRAERRAAKRYAHKVASWRPCWLSYRRPCLRCAWREITGRNRRDKAAELARVANYWTQKYGRRP